MTFQTDDKYTQTLSAATMFGMGWFKSLVW